MADKSTKKKKSDGTFKQLLQVYRFTARNDKALPWWMALVFVAPIIVLIVVCLVTKANVLIYALEDGSSVIVRPSGTEPKIKTYFTTLGKDLAEAQAEKDKLAEAIKPILS